MRERLKELLIELMRIPGLSGHEGRVRRYLKERLVELGLTTRTDGLGNLIAPTNHVQEPNHSTSAEYTVAGNSQCA